ncbi:MAG: CopC domain [Actinomycetota bacterium]|nr:CopC domain [Actinomycetota bacterium]
MPSSANLKGMNRGLTAAIALSLLLVGSAARAGSPTSPVLLSADPPDGAKLDRAPSTVTLSFSEPIDAHYSHLEVYDSCGNNVDVGHFTADLNKLSVKLEKKPSGRYSVFYVANATPKGATGETTGTLKFTVKKGRPCRAKA